MWVGAFVMGGGGESVYVCVREIFLSHACTDTHIILMVNVFGLLK